MWITELFKSLCNFFTNISLYPSRSTTLGHHKLTEWVAPWSSRVWKGLISLWDRTFCALRQRGEKLVQAHPAEPFNFRGSSLCSQWIFCCQVSKFPFSALACYIFPILPKSQGFRTFFSPALAPQVSSSTQSMGCLGSGLWRIFSEPQYFCVEGVWFHGQRLFWA